MTLLKCFTNTFDSYMTENGYRRKGKLYYRLRGEILQGIVLRAIDHYDVCYTCFPYWSYQYRQPAYSLEWLSKGFWAEIGESIPGTCFRYNSDEENVRVMEEIRQLIETEVMPMLNDVCDLDSYLRFVCESNCAYTNRSIQYWGWSSDSQPRMRQGKLELNSYDLLIKALRDGDFKEADFYIEEVLLADQKRERFQLSHNQPSRAEIESHVNDHIEMLREMCPDMPYEVMEQEARRLFDRDMKDIDERVNKSRQNYIDYRLKHFESCKQNGNLVEISTWYETQCQIMKDALRLELHLEV